MAFSIKNDTTDDLLRQLTELTGESLTTAVTEALRERLERERRVRASAPERVDPVAEAVARFRAIAGTSRDPSDDPDSILGYDERGLPT